MKEALKQDTEMSISGSLSRRKFLNYAGAVAGAGILIASCKKDETTAAASEDAVELGSNDTGLLNLAYLLKQLSAAFYIQVLKSPYPGITDTERGFFMAMRDHSIAHREVLKNYLAADGIPTLENDWTTVDFSLKNSVLSKVQLIEETNTAGMCDICRLISSSDHLNVLSKMAMVDARHSAVANDFIYLGAFSYQADDNGMQIASDPQNTLEVVRKFFKKKLSGIYLPKY